MGMRSIMAKEIGLEELLGLPMRVRAALLGEREGHGSGESRTRKMQSATNILHCTLARERSYEFPSRERRGTVSG